MRLCESGLLVFMFKFHHLALFGGFAFHKFFMTFRSAIFETTLLLIADSWSSMQQTTTALTIEAGKVGLCTNPEKCKILTTSVWNDRTGSYPGYRLRHRES